jgi:hypothetical protein
MTQSPNKLRLRAEFILKSHLLLEIWVPQLEKYFEDIDCLGKKVYISIVFGRDEQQKTNKKG